MREVIVVVGDEPICHHSHYHDGHCAQMTCWNYYSKCPKHSPSGSDQAECSIVRARRELVGRES